MHGDDIAQTSAAKISLWQAASRSPLSVFVTLTTNLLPWYLDVLEAALPSNPDDYRRFVFAEQVGVSLLPFLSTSSAAAQWSCEIGFLPGIVRLLSMSRSLTAEGCEAVPDQGLLPINPFLRVFQTWPGLWRRRTLCDWLPSLWAILDCSFQLEDRI